MEIRNFNVAQYKGCRIYFRHFADHFEYLTIARSQLFTDNVRVRPALWGKVQKALRLRRTAYDEETLGRVIQILLNKAKKNIDFILSKEYEREIKKRDRALAS